MIIKKEECEVCGLLLTAKDREELGNDTRMCYRCWRAERDLE